MCTITSLSVPLTFDYDVQRSTPALELPAGSSCMFHPTPQAQQPNIASPFVHLCRVLFCKVVRQRMSSTCWTVTRRRMLLGVVFGMWDCDPCRVLGSLPKISKAQQRYLIPVCALHLSDGVVCFCRMARQCMSSICWTATSRRMLDLRMCGQTLMISTTCMDLAALRVGATVFVRMCRDCGDGCRHSHRVHCLPVTAQPLCLFITAVCCSGC
jgi:hypothetical protein